MDLLWTKTQLFQYWLKESGSLGFVRTIKRESSSSPATNSGVERLKSVSAHDDDGWEITPCQIVHTTNQSVDPRAVFMVHLPKFAGLSQCIGLVNQKDDPRMV